MCGGPILAPESWTLRELVSAGWMPEELEWESGAETGMACLAAGDAAGAGARFAKMVRLAHASFSGDDPRLATSLANHAAALVAAGQAGLSGLSIRDARRIWRDCGAWIARMTAPRVARSSLFHMRMEQRHRAEYEARWRVKWAELAAEARERVGEGGSLTLVSAAEAGERLARWRRERPAMLNDTRKLMGAVMLLAVRGDPSPSRLLKKSETAGPRCMRTQTPTRISPLSESIFPGDRHRRIDFA